MSGRPPSGSGWIHEIKHDGYRIVARRADDAVRMWTKQQNETSGRFQAIAAALRRLPIDCVLDGEAVVFRPDGHADFHALRSSAGAASASYVCFDLLEADGEDLRRCPVEERRERLAALLRERPGNGALIFSEAFEQDGHEVFAQACALGLEGIVSKRRGSIYRSGPSAEWVKTLNTSYQRDLPPTNGRITKPWQVEPNL